MTFAELQTEVARRSARNNSTQFTDAIKNAVNAALIRVARDGYWRVLRRETSFNTVTSYTTGSGAGTFTNNSANITVTGATFITDGIRVGRMIKLQGSTKRFSISKVTGEETITLDRVYDGTTISGTGTYEIYPQEEYVLPIQVTHRCFLWHEEEGFPKQLHFITDQNFLECGIDRTTSATPTHYRMWNADSLLEQVKNDSVITFVSSDANDTTKYFTVYGTVSGMPDSEAVTLNGTTPVSTTKTFSSVERIVRRSTTAGVVTITADSGNTTVSKFPTGSSTEQIFYYKVMLYPLPDSVFPVKVYYYKDVYRLDDDDDVHELGDEFDEPIVLLASAKIQAETGQNEAAAFMQLYDDEIKSLKRTNTDKIDMLNVLRGSGGKKDPLIHPSLSYKQLGGYYGPEVG